jgi:hypothetical protein
MTYSRPELDWIEAEWAYHLHGRSAFLGSEDFAQIVVWDKEGVTAEMIVNSMEAFFSRRAKHSRPRTFVSLKHLAKDVQKAFKLAAAMAKAGSDSIQKSGWESVKEPLRSDPRARAAFEKWMHLKASAPGPDSPGFLDHFDQERQAMRNLLVFAEEALASRRVELDSELRGRLLDSKLTEGSLVWKRAWDHHWTRIVLESWGIEA